MNSAGAFNSSGASSGVSFTPSSEQGTALPNYDQAMNQHTKDAPLSQGLSGASGGAPAPQIIYQTIFVQAPAPIAVSTSTTPPLWTDGQIRRAKILVAVAIVLALACAAAAIGLGTHVYDDTDDTDKFFGNSRWPTPFPTLRRTNQGYITGTGFLGSGAVFFGCSALMGGITLRGALRARQHALAQTSSTGHTVVMQPMTVTTELSPPYSVHQTI